MFVVYFAAVLHAFETWVSAIFFYIFTEQSRARLCHSMSSVCDVQVPSNVKSNEVGGCKCPVPTSS